MTEVRVSIVDVYVLRRGPAELEALCLRRARGTRCAGTWETVHGHIQPGEAPAAAARRELREETGLAPARLYNLSRVETFYLHKTDELALIPVFAAIVDGAAAITLSHEHDGFEWLPIGQAGQRMAWPREGRALADVVKLLGDGTAGGLEDVLLVQ